MIVQIEIPDEELDKSTLLRLLAEQDTKVLATAYLYAKNFVTYGVNVTEKWDTAVRNSDSLTRAYHDGYRNGYRRAHEDSD
jgi:hypothetical protein